MGREQHFTSGFWPTGMLQSTLFFAMSDSEGISSVRVAALPSWTDVQR